MFKYNLMIIENKFYSFKLEHFFFIYLRSYRQRFTKHLISAFLNSIFGFKRPFFFLVTNFKKKNTHSSFVDHTLNLIT